MHFDHCAQILSSLLLDALSSRRPLAAGENFLRPERPERAWCSRRQNALVHQSPSFRQDTKAMTSVSGEVLGTTRLKAIWRVSRFHDELDSHQLVVPLVVITFVTGVSFSPQRLAL